MAGAQPAAPRREHIPRLAAHDQAAAAAADVEAERGSGERADERAQLETHPSGRPASDHELSGDPLPVGAHGRRAVGKLVGGGVCRGAGQQGHEGAGRRESEVTRHRRRY